MRRFDIQKIDGFEVTTQGFLKVPVFTGRTGIQVYKSRDGKELREYRPPEEVFAAKTMDSLRNLPVTNESGGHPQVFVNVDNAKKLMCGYTVDALPEKIDGQYQKTFAVIYDKEAIERVKDGKLEVSLGYDVDVDFTPGVTPDGQKYDAIQRNIVNNHLAMVDRARGGREIRLRLDGQDAILVTEGDNHEEDSVHKIKIGDKEFEVSKEVFDAFNAAEKARGDADKAAGEKMTAAQGDLTKVTKERDTLQGKVDSLSDELKTAKADGGKGNEKKLDQAAIDKAVAERRKVEKVAEKTLDAEGMKKLDSMSNADVKKAVIKAQFKDADLTGKSDEYVDARFDHIAEQLSNSDANKTESGLRVINGRKQAGKDAADQSDADKAREKSMQSDSDAWKQPLGKKSQ